MAFLWVDGEETGRKLCFGSVACHHEQAPAWRRLSRVGFLPWGGGALGSLLGFESRKRKPIRQSIEEEDDGAGIGWIDWR